MVARESDLWITKPDGSEQRRLTNNGNGNADPCISPDGRWLAAQVGPPLGQHIWRMNLDGSDPKQLTFEKDFQVSHAITPDAKWIYYTNVVGQKLKLFRIPAAGGKPIEVYDGDVDWLRISPKGDLLAFLNYDPEKSPKEAIAIMRVEGGPVLRRLTLPYNVQWSRDGRALFYPKKSGNASAIWLQPLDGSPPQQMTGLLDGDIINFDLSPDNKQFAIARGRQVGDVVMITSVE
jgi:Tol biopolymer transport system component